MSNVAEVFKQFCKERHAEDKGKNYDLLQEVYASTEFFDTSLYDHSKDAETNVTLNTEKTSYGMKCIIKTPEGVNLPFQNNFIKYFHNTYIFIREYTPTIVTGSFYTLPNGMNCPFSINTYFDHIEIILIYGSYEEIKKATVQNTEIADKIALLLFKAVALVVMDLNNLSHKAVAVDRPSNPNFCEYYRRKRKPAIKIPQRPIYYVLGDKKEDVSVKYKSIKSTGTLEYSYAFKVRGHWRRIGDKTLGKDRNGIYGIRGYTWVVEHTRGEGELAKRLHVIK